MPRLMAALALAVLSVAPASTALVCRAGGETAARCGCGSGGTPMTVRQKSDCTQAPSGPVADGGRARTYG